MTNFKKVISATEDISQGAEGIILESVLEGMAEYYSAELAEKVTRDMTENAVQVTHPKYIITINALMPKDIKAVKEKLFVKIGLKMPF